MAINRISGNILQDDLRRGANLAIQGNLIYFDVSNDRVGILTSSPQEDFDVDGNLRVGNVTILEAGNIDAGNVWINNLQDPVANSDAATKNYVDNVSGNVNVVISDGANTQQVFNGSIITFLDVANETTVVVSAVDTVTIGLPADVVISNSLSVPGNVTAGNIISNNTVSTQTLLASADITGNNVTSNNAVTTATVTASGNITANNITSNNDVITTSVTASGNIVANNVISNNDVTTATVTATGNITGNNITSNNVVTSISVDATGNITGNNLISNNDVTTVTVTASGNVTGTTFLGNVEGNYADFTGNVTAASFIGNIDAGGANTEIQFNDDDILAGSPGFTFDKTSNLVSISGNVSAANVVTAGIVEATGNVTGGNIVTVGTVDATGNVTGGNLLSPGQAEISGNITANNITSNNDVATITVTASGNIALTGTLIGNRILGNNDLSISSQSDQNITLDPGLGLVDIDTTSGLVIPVGNTAQRPGGAVTGTIRYNTEIQRVEIYDGAEWDEVLSDVSGQIITPSGSTNVFALDRATSNVAALVAINGVVQLPGVAYSVIGNVITFAETPLTTDIIDIRFL